jgi:CBS domain-containing protein
MRCYELMERQVHYCRPTDSVDEVARKMRDHSIGFVPVCNSELIVVGTLTDRDLAIRVTAQNLIPAKTTVDSVMSRDVVSCSPDDDIDVAEQLMVHHKKGRIVCVSEKGELQGVISLSDLFEVEPDSRAAQVFRSVSSRETAFLMI